MTLDVFLESDEEIDREEVERVLARNGVPTDSTVTTADGGEASVTLDDDGSVFVIQSLTPEVAQILFDVASTARLAILPADGTPTALVAGDAAVPDELERVHIESAEALYESLRRSEELRGARSA
ncbi:MAG TPA: hypothetical protein VF232_00180 [Gaiellaceae bacterium]